MFIILLSACVISKLEAARILGVFPTPSISHQVVFQPLMKELVNRGHEVVVITTDPIYPSGQGPKNLTEIDLHDISYDIWTKLTKSGEFNIDDPRHQAKIIFEKIALVFEKQMKTPLVQKLLNDKNNNFDLVFTESCIRLSLVFSYLYKAPLIEISSLGGLYGTFDGIVSPIHPLLYPIANQQKTYQLSMWEKIYQLYVYYGIGSAYQNLEKMENNLLKTLFGPNTPDLQDLKKNVDMLFLNIHSVWDFNRPVPPNVLYLGGLHLQRKPVKELPKDLKNFLDSSSEGVIYMSFGTNVLPSALPAERIKIITNVFSDLPYKILWRWDSDKIPKHSKNVLISKWFPQSDLLGHPNIKLFVTQGGLQSTDEALTAGVPLVVIPMLGDQWYNAEQYQYHGIGKKLLIEDLDENSFKETILSVISNSSYRENVVRLRKIMRDETQTPLEKAVWWTEYVIRHKGAAHLRARGAHMPWTEYYEINLIIVLISILFIVTAVLVVTLKLIISQLNFVAVKRKLN
ncbi:UDP-glucosyltransferase 2-like [Danaus plexippus]|uniref:UDP-glucosyltransferase 2-like n=1 Tax=Danaus plexippus TaxID=13037 RepID=UPI002AB062BA|nr:UDP-glucosyltransferase 2-like [Danaus plexippus]